MHVLGARKLWEDGGRQVFVIYGSEAPFDAKALKDAVAAQKGEATTMAMPDDTLEKYLNAKPPVVLTDAYAPVDNLMSVTFRKR